jgi:hypothetical protein
MNKINCTKRQRIIRRKKGADNIETYRCINHSSKVYREIVSEDTCKQCNFQKKDKKSCKLKTIPFIVSKEELIATGITPEEIPEKIPEEILSKYEKLTNKTSKKEKCC